MQLVHNLIKFFLNLILSAKTCQGLLFLFDFWLANRKLEMRLVGKEEYTSTHKNISTL